MTIFREISWPFVFQRLRVLKQIFVSRKLKYLDADIMKCSCFLNLVFSQKTFYCRKLIVLSCLQFADCYIWSRILSCGVTFMLNHFYGIFFWKVFVKKTLSWRCRKHMFVFEIVSLKDLDKFMIKLSFSCDFFLVKDFVRHYGKSLKTFPFWALTFFLFRKVKLRNLEGWLFWVGALRKVLMCSLFLEIGRASCRERV